VYSGRLGFILFSVDGFISWLSWLISAAENFGINPLFGGFNIRGIVAKKRAARHFNRKVEAIFPDCITFVCFDFFHFSLNVLSGLDCR
jgi:hypothetical protein